jgi:hypothetical protein
MTLPSDIVERFMKMMVSSQKAGVMLLMWHG